jgi:hypothetical protein
VQKTGKNKLKINLKKKKKKFFYSPGARHSLNITCD